MLQFNEHFAAIAATIANGNATFVDISAVAGSAPQTRHSLSIGAEIGIVFGSVFGLVGIANAFIAWLWVG